MSVSSTTLLIDDEAICRFFTAVSLVFQNVQQIVIIESLVGEDMRLFLTISPSCQEDLESYSYRYSHETNSSRPHIVKIYVTYVSFFSRSTKDHILFDHSSTCRSYLFPSNLLHTGTSS